MSHFREVDRDQGFAIVAAQAGKVKAPHERAHGFGRDAEALGDLSVGELFDRHGLSGWSSGGRERGMGVVSGRLT
jgi:hypothetical protein